MQNTAAGGVDYEVEGDREGEEGDEMQSLVGLRRDVFLCCFRGLREGGVWEETEGGGEEEEDKECDCTMSV